MNVKLDPVPECDARMDPVPQRGIEPPPEPPRSGMEPPPEPPNVP